VTYYTADRYSLDDHSLFLFLKCLGTPFESVKMIRFLLQKFFWYESESSRYFEGSKVKNSQYFSESRTNKKLRKNRNFYEKPIAKKIFFFFYNSNNNISSNVYIGIIYIP